MKTYFFHYILLLFALMFLGIEKTEATTQFQPVFKLDSVSSFVGLNKYWKYHPGDNLQWATPTFDDSRWDTTNTRLSSFKLSDTLFNGIIWFRLPLLIDSILVDKMLTLAIQHSGASEIYLDGKLIHRFGKPSSEQSKEEIINPKHFPLNIQFHKAGLHLLAVRYSNLSAQLWNQLFKESFPGFYAKIGNGDLAITYLQYYLVANVSIFIALFSFLIALTLLHLFLYLFYRANKSNLYYSIFTLRLGLCSLFVNVSIVSSNPYVVGMSNLAAVFTFYGIFNTLLNLTYSLFYSSKPKWSWILRRSSQIGIVVFFTPLFWWSYILLLVIGNIIITIVITHTIKAIKQKKDGAWIIGMGILCFISFIIIFSMTAFIRHSFLLSMGYAFMAILGILSIPLSMSVYLARNFAKTNKNLQLQLIQVQELSDKTIEQEKEKKKIIESQKEELEIQVAERTSELAQKNKDITDSISYAQRIQQAKLPLKEEISSSLPNCFVLFKPKDIVSGDFYFFHKNNNKFVFIAAADCTGHGVPGAFMSIIGCEKLDDAVSKSTDTSEILKQLNKGIKASLRQSDRDESTRDGMDIALCSLNIEKRIVKYAGANRPLWLIRNEQTEIEEIKGTKNAIGGLTEDIQHFDTHELKLQSGDTFYIFSDGYADTFSGETGKKLTTKKFKEILLDIQHKTMQEQERHLDNFIENWKAGTEQVDDILVIGVRL